MFRTTAIYARVSSDKQAREGTIESQLAALREFVARKGWRVDPDREFVDNGYSGATLARPALDRLRDEIACGQIQRVVVLSVDRLSRRFVHQALLREEWERVGCELVVINEPEPRSPQDQVLNQIKAVFAEYEREVLLERTRRGLLHRARRGEPPPSAPYGYRYVPGEGHTPAHWEIEPVQAEWVRKIYRWMWQEHLGIRAIARRLNEMAVPPPGGGQIWRESTVHRILVNPAYRGEVYYNRSGRDGKAEMGRDGHGRMMKLEQEWIKIEVPAIVEGWEWEMVQQELKRHKELALRNARPGRYLLQGLVRCGVCGRKMRGRKSDGHLYYHCRSKQELLPEKRCRSKWVRAERIEELVWEAVKRLIMEPEQVLRSYQEQREIWLREGKEKERRELEREKKRLESRHKRLVDAYEVGVISLEELVERRRKIEKAKQELKRRWHEWEEKARNWQAYTEALSSLVRYREVLKESLESLTFERKRELIKLLVEEVVVYEDKVVIRHILPTDSSLCSPHLERGREPPKATGGGEGNQPAAGDVERMSSSLSPPKGEVWCGSRRSRRYTIGQSIEFRIKEVKR